MNRNSSRETLQAPVRAAEIVREYGPFAGAENIHTDWGSNPSSWFSSERRLRSARADPTRSTVARATWSVTSAARTRWLLRVRVLP